MREKVLDFILNSEGEVKGLLEAESMIKENLEANYQNAVEADKASAQVIKSLNKVSSTLDVSLINLDLKNSENLISDFFDLITTVRQAISREIVSVSKVAGITQGKYIVLNDMSSTLAEKVKSKEAMLANQRELLTKAESGVSLDKRVLGERPHTLKAKRQFEDIVSDKEEQTGQTVEEGE